MIFRARLRSPALLLMALAGAALVACAPTPNTSGGISAPDSYTIGGSVSGLTASGLVLLNNGGDALDVAANATSFTFDTTLTGGSPYDVTVKTQPQNETCAVGNSSGTATANVTTVSVSCVVADVAAVTVEQGPGSNPSVDEAYVSVTVCQGSTCGTIDDVMLDTGSSGLRLLASALKTAELTPPTVPDPNNPGNTMAECFPMSDGSLWGPLTTLSVSIGGETTTAAIPVQVIDDNSSYAAAPSSGCSNPTLGTINALAANGVLGVGLANQDCGTACQTNTANDVYWTCSDSGCSSTTFTGQVANPVASFPADNNGVIVQLPAVSDSGATTVNGSLIFGIGTESNNGLGTAIVLTASSAAGSFGQITTLFSGGTCPGGDCPDSFIDASSKGNFFNDSSIPTCTVNSKYYCPATTISLSATNQGQNGTQSGVAFQVAALTGLSSTDYAFNDVGGPATDVTLGNYFEWGLPFFFGRSVYFAIENMAAAGTKGPYYAY